MAIKDRVSRGINKLGEDVTIYNSNQTTDSDTAYDSITADDYLDGTNTGTSEKAVVQPAKQRNDQSSEGRLTEGEMLAFFKEDSVVTKKSLVRVDSTNYLYKVKSIDRLGPSGELTHYEIILEFVRDLSQ